MLLRFSTDLCQWGDIRNNMVSSGSMNRRRKIWLSFINAIMNWILQEVYTYHNNFLVVGFVWNQTYIALYVYNCFLTLTLRMTNHLLYKNHTINSLFPMNLKELINEVLAIEFVGKFNQIWTLISICIAGSHTSQRRIQS